MPPPSSAEDSPLAELVFGSAGLGRWTLKIVGPPKVKEYTYQWDGKTNNGKAFTVLLISKDTTQYCYGKFTRRGKQEAGNADFRAAMEKFQDGTVWLFTKATLITKEKPLYIGSSVKAVIDLNSSKNTPVLQSTGFAQLMPTPAEDLTTLLEAAKNQRVDVTALVVKMSDVQPRKTVIGPRLIVDITIRDGSGSTGASDCALSMFFPDSTAGRADVDNFKRCYTDGTPVALFNLSIGISDDGKNTLKPHREEFHWQPATMGERAAQLTAAIEVLRSTDQATCVTEIPEFVLKEKMDYVTPGATLTVARLLRNIVRSDEGLPDAESTHLFQMNLVRVIEPAVGDCCLTNDGSRLFVPVTVQDHTAQVELRMREKAALELSGHGDRDAFCEEVRTGGLNFPVLASVRVVVRNKNSTTSDARASADASASEHAVSAIIVEAVDQDMKVPKAMPNASMDYVNTLLKHLGGIGVDRMLVAPASTMRHSAHGGLIVQDDDGTRYAGACVMTMLAHVGKCTTRDLEGGHRIVTAKPWNIPFENQEVADREPEIPQYANEELTAQFVSYCTMNNVQYFTLSSRKAQQPVYAIVVVGSAHVANKVTTFMMNKVQTMAVEDVEPTRQIFAKLCVLSKRIAQEVTSPAAKMPWSEALTPYRAKKSRRLTMTPTDTSIE
jgi:hypothetical protein